MDFESLEKTAFRGKGRIQFLTQKPVIEEAIARGYPLKLIWGELKKEGAFDAKYHQFLAYVKKHCHVQPGPIEKLDLKKIREQPTLSPDATKSREPKWLKPPEKPKLDFDLSIIGKEHLIRPYNGPKADS